MTYKLDWMERKTTSVGDKWNCNLSASDGTHEGITLWVKDWPTVALAQTVEGELVVKQNGQYTNKTLYPLKASPRASTGFRKPNMEAVVAQKNENIRENMDTKHEAIKMAGAQRDAVLMVTTFNADGSFNDDELKEKIEEWYQYFLNRGSQPF